MSLVHLTEIKGDRNSDEEINRLSAGKRWEGEREREAGRVYWFKGPTMPSFRPRTHGRIIEFSRLQTDEERKERQRARDGVVEKRE